MRKLSFVFFLIALSNICFSQGHFDKVSYLLRSCMTTGEGGVMELEWQVAFDSSQAILNELKILADIEEAIIIQQKVDLTFKDKVVLETILNGGHEQDELVRRLLNWKNDFTLYAREIVLSDLFEELRSLKENLEAMNANDEDIILMIELNGSIPIILEMIESLEKD